MASETAQFFAAVRKHLEASRPDVLVMIQNDHFNTFFLNNWPTFAIGRAVSVRGPSDQTPAMPEYEVSLDASLASEIYRGCIAAEFDLASSEEMTADHAVLVPLHFMTPAMNIPIVPVFINCLVPPLPSAHRCHWLGAAIRAAIERFPESTRVAVIASGSLSLEVGGPLIDPGKTFGVPDKKWAAWIVERLEKSDHLTLLNAATPERMEQAGNVGGELLNWICLLGAIGPRKPEILINQPEFGNAFAAWSLEGQAG